jgi:hypothetical protein
MTRVIFSAAVLFFGWIAVVAAQDAADLTVKVEAPRSDLVIQPNKELPIQITVMNKRGQGIGGMRVETDCSAGSLSKVEDLGAGQYRAIYRMPAQRHPQAVLVAAMVPGAVPGFAVIPLRARAELAVNTDKTRVNVTLTLAGRRYGPVMTDGSGQVKIPVEIGPGETTGQAEAVDEFGNHTTRWVNLDIPPSPGLVGFVERSELATDGEDFSNVYLIAVSPDGGLASQVSLAVKKTTGSVSDIQRLRAGLFRLRYTAPAGLKSSAAQLTISDPNNPLNVRNFQIRLSAGHADRLTIAVDPSHLTSSRQGVARITIHVIDTIGGPVAGRQPNLTCSLGGTTPIAETAPGTYEASFTPPYGARGEVTCVATLPRGKRPELRTEGALQLSSPKPAKLRARAIDSTLSMNGKSATDIEIMVFDSDGDALEGVPISGAVPIGTLGSAHEQGQGRYVLRYQAPQGTQDRSVSVYITTGTEADAASTAVTLSLKGVGGPTPFLQIGPWLGLTTNFKQVQPAFSFDAALRLPFADSRFYLGLEAGYRGGWTDHLTAETGTQFKTQLDLIPLFVVLLFKPFPHAEPIKPVVLIGGGVEVVKDSVTQGSLPLKPDYHVAGGGVAGLGAELKLGIGALFFQARYLYSSLSHTLGPGHITSTIGGFEIGIGYQLYFSH